MIVDLLPEIVQKGRRDYGFYPRPSYAGPEQCLRKLAYMAMGVKGEEVEHAAVTLDDSSWHERHTLEWVSKVFRVHSEQLRVTCGMVTWEGRPFPVRGRIDAVITDGEKKNYLLEHKAVSQYAFDRYSKLETYPLDYLTQCVLYWVGLEKVIPLSGGVLLMKNKNNSHYLEYLFSYDSMTDTLEVKNIATSNGLSVNPDLKFERLYGNAMERLRLLEGFRTGEIELPERQYTQTDWQCQYCQYQKTCWEE